MGLGKKKCIITKLPIKKLRRPKTKKNNVLVLVVVIAVGSGTVINFTDLLKFKFLV